MYNHLLGLGQDEGILYTEAELKYSDCLVMTYSVLGISAEVTVWCYFVSQRENSPAFRPAAAIGISYSQKFTSNIVPQKMI